MTMHINSLFSIIAFAVIVLAILPQLVTAANDDNCRVPADPDTLGLGVRLGLYFQLSSNFLLQLVRVEEGRDSFLPSFFFFTSFFIAVVFSAARNEFAPGALIACTWYPVLVYVALGSCDFRGFKPAQQVARWFVTFLLWMAACCLNIWFWFKGIDASHPDQCMEPRCFFFANLPATGGIRVVFRILTLLPVIGFIVLFIAEWIKKEEKILVEDNEIGEMPLSAPTLVNEKLEPAISVAQFPSKRNSTLISTEE